MQWIQKYRDIAEYLGVLGEIKITFHNMLIWKNQRVRGLYYPVADSKNMFLHHHIDIAADAVLHGYDHYMSVIAHELVHAWQYESGNDYTKHTKRSQFVQCCDNIAEQFGIIIQRRY